MASIGSLVASLGMDTANFDKGIKGAVSKINKFKRAASKKFKKVQESVKRVAGAMFKMGAAAAAAGVALGSAMIKASLESVDALAKTADKLGVTTEALAGLRHAAELTGVSTSTMDMALQRMTRRVAEAAQGSGEAVKALEELGISATELQKLPLDVQMQVVADAMGEVESQSDKVRLAMKLFDSEGVALVNTLAGGSEGLKSMAAEADALGITVSRIDAAQIEAANDAVTRAKGVFTGLGNQLATAFAPIIQGIADNFSQSALDAAEFGNVGQQVADKVVAGYAKMAGWIQHVIQFTLFATSRTTDWAASFLQLAASINRALSPVESLARMYNFMAESMGKDTFKLPSERLDDFANDLIDTSAKSQAALDAMIAREPAEIGILNAYEKIKVASRKAAEEVSNKLKLKPIEIPVITKLEIPGKKNDEINQATESMKKSYQSVFAHWDQGVQGMKNVFLSNVREMIQSKVLSQLGKMFMSMMGSPTGGILGGVASLLGFANGGSFEVGGQGGTDSNIVAFRATKGERVSVSTPGQQAAGGGSGGVTVINNIDAGGSGDMDVRIRAAVEHGSAQTIATIQDLMRRGRFA